MDPAYLQQEMMKKAMMGQGSRPMANAGGRIGFEEGHKVPEEFLEHLKRKNLHKLLEEHRRWKENYERRKDLGVTQEAAEGGIMRMGFKKGGDWTRRKFLQFIGGAAALPIVGKYFKAAKLAKPAAAVTETITRGADGMPKYVIDLIEVVKAKGTKDIIEGFKRSDYSTVHSYKGVDVIEDPLGNIKIKSDRGGVATDSTTGKLHEGIAEERRMQIEKGEYVKNKKGKMVKEKDEYIEGSVRPDMDGKMKDFEEGLDEDAHEFFKKIADEINEEVIIKKASGGLAYMLGE